jgi:electron-transferring-flavoprotein dehydrogenase
MLLRCAIYLNQMVATLPVNVNLLKWDEPAQRYFPTGVYEIMESDDGS